MNTDPSSILPDFMGGAGQERPHVGRGIEGVDVVAPGGQGHVAVYPDHRPACHIGSEGTTKIQPEHKI